MSMRITIMDKRFNNPRPFKQYKPIYTQHANNDSIYVPSSKHVSRRSQSPFRKYEECIKQKMASSSPKCQSLERKKANIYQENFVNIKRLEDFKSGFPAKDQSSFHRNEHFFDFLSNSSLKIKDDKEEQNFIFCSSCITTKLNTNREQIENFETLKIEEPLGTPDPEEKRFDFYDDKNIDIHLNPETSEQFIDLLVAEDKLLRKKIANCKIDEKTKKKLDRLKELRERYNEFKQSKRKIVQIPITHETSQRNKMANLPPRQFSNANIAQISSKPMRKKFSLGLSKVKSLSDPDFSLELSRHPLVKE